jgi:hypothetical protein
MQEGDGTVLENSCLMFINNMWSGSKHDSTKVPLLMAGNLGGSIATGNVLNFEDKPDEGRKLCSLYLTLLRRMGQDAKSFGDAETGLSLATSPA